MSGRIGGRELTKLYQEIGRRVQLQRYFLQLSQRDIADRISVTVETLVKIEAGRIRAPSYFLRRYAKLCRVPVICFFKRSMPNGGPGLGSDDKAPASNVVPFKKRSRLGQATTIKRAA